MRGEIDAVHEISPTRSSSFRLKDRPTSTPIPFVRPYYVHLVFNIRHPLLKNADRPAGSQLRRRSPGDDRPGAEPARERLPRVRSGPSTGPTARRRKSTRTTSKRRRFGWMPRGCGCPRTVVDARPDAGQIPSQVPHDWPRNHATRRWHSSCRNSSIEIGVDMEIEARAGQRTDFPPRRRKIRHWCLMERTSGRSLVWTYLSFHSSQNPVGLHPVGQGPRSPSRKRPPMLGRDGGQRSAAGSSTTIRLQSSSSGRRSRASSVRSS